jgi:hypothetical protein
MMKEAIIERLPRILLEPAADFLVKAGIKTER